MPRSKTSKTPDLRDIKTPGVAGRLNAERPTEPGGFTASAEPMDPEPSAQGGELSSTPEEKLPAQSAAKSVKTSLEPIPQSEIDELGELYRHMVRSVHRTVRYMVKIGEKCCAIKARLSHGQWGPWVRRNLPFTIRTATRAMQTYHRFKSDPGLLDDPEDFMAQIYGNNESRQLKDTSDVETKSDVKSDISNIDEEDDDAELPSSRPAKVSPEEWSGMMLVKELGKTLDGYLSQPVAETLKLQVLIHAYHILAARLEPQAKKCNLTLEQALGQEYRNL